MPNDPKTQDSTAPSHTNPTHTPIQALRLQRGMSLNELAAATRLDPAHLELIERQSHFATPNRAEMEAIAAALKVTVEELLVQVR
jgi:transcriptional regulator with XRE-family HTH domain